MASTPFEEINIAAPKLAEPFEQTVSNQQKAAIADVLTTVSPVLRQALTLWAVEQLTFKELADALGVPLSTAAQRVRRGLMQVRGKLANKGYEVRS